MTIDRRKVRWGGNAGIAILVGLGLCVLTNAIAERRFKRWDWTGSKIYSLSDKTLKILQNLKSDVEVTVLLQPSVEMYDEVREILNNYRARSALLKVEFLDPGKEPARVQQMLRKFGIDPRGDTTAVVFSSGERHKHVAVSDLVDYDMAEPEMGGEGPRVKAFKGESAFTSAILSVSETRQKSIYFVKGHGEASIDGFDAQGLGEFAKLLKRENFKTETTEALGKSALPADCDLMVLASPTQGFTEPEARSLADYLDSGGHLLALIDPPLSREGSALQKLGIEETLLRRGIALGDDIVFEPDPGHRLLFQGAETFAVTDFPDHPITRDFREASIVLQIARSVAPVQPPPAGWSISPLARTTDASWGERDLAHLATKIEKGAEDLKGPVCLAVAAEKKGEGGKTARAVVIGDSDLGRNRFIGAAANLDFLLNCVHWLAGSEEQIGIVSREPEQVHLILTGGQEKAVMFFTLLGMPGLAVGGGVVVWLFRRR